MRAVVTRVSSASVSIGGTVEGAIEQGFLVLLGVGPGDTEAVCDKLAEKICNLRVFEDENGRMNLSLEQVGGALLVVSQFTLYADTSSRRPGFTGAARPDLAVPLYERFMEQCRRRGFQVEHGTFGADMQVASVNDGPVTILFDRHQLLYSGGRPDEPGRRHRSRRRAGADPGGAGEGGGGGPVSPPYPRPL